MPRRCSCPHGFPLCACHERLTGDALLRRSRWLSSLAGWPGRLDPDAVAAHEAAVAAAASAPAAEAAGRERAPAPAPIPAHEEAILERHRRRVATVKERGCWEPHECGCSAGRCKLGKGQLGTGLVGFEECFGCLGI